MRYEATRDPGASRTFHSDIFSYITEQEAAYKNAITLPGNWMWGMKEHLETSYLYINSQLTTGGKEFKPVRNIILPILNLQHRTEDIEVKDVQIYVNDPQNYHLSFLVKKYHDDVFVVENDMETFFDDLNVSRIDFGAGLSKQLNKPCPEVVELQSIAFCDQTDILSGPIGIRHFYSPDQLMEMKKVGWGDKNNGATATVEDAIHCSEEAKREENTKNDTPGRYVEVIEVHGNLPKNFAYPDGDYADSQFEYETRIFIVAMYMKGGKRAGCILYTAPESEMPFKLIKRDKIYGRALGRGGAEELFDSQVWTNYDMIRMNDMLDAASKVIMSTTDPVLAARNNMRDMENLEIVERAPGTEFSQVDTFPRNYQLFDNAVMKWEEHARTLGAASDAILGENPSTNTPFKLQDAVIRQGLGLHEYRRGQYAKHLEEVYTDWIIPHIEKKITEGARFLSELSLEEMQYITDSLVTNMANQKIIEMVINGEEVNDDIITEFKELTRAEFRKKGNKHFIEILKGEFKNKPLAVKVSVKGKSKDLGARTDALVNVFRQVIANPAVLQIPAIARIFNDIIESSGLEPADFTGITTEQLQGTGAVPGATPPGTEPQVLTQPGLAAQPQQA